jgi:hypothetical protein
MAFIYNLSDTWNDAATTWNGIKLAVTNTSSDASSKLLNLTVTGASTASFVVDKSGNLVLNGSVNKITMTAPATGATLTLADGSTFVTSGAYSSTFTFSGTTTLTFPTSGTVTALGNTTTGSGAIVLASSPTLVTPALGTPSSGVLSSCTGYAVGNLTGTGTGVLTALAVNVGSAGAFVTFNGALGTPSSGDLTNCTGITPSNIGGLGAGVATWLGTPSSANLAAAVTDETGSGALVFATSPTLVSPALGTPTSVNLTYGTNLPISTGVDGLGAGVATFLATPSSANLASAVTDETGSGPLVFATSPTFTSAVTLGTASSTRGTLVLANTSANTVTLQSSNSTAATYTLTFPAAAPVNGYYLQTDTNGVLSWAAGGGGGGGSPGGSNTQVQFNNAGAFGGDAAFTFVNGTGTATMSLGVASTTSAALKLYNSASANSVSLASGNNTASWTLTLPPDDGSANQFLQTDGSGNTIWAAAAAGTINTGTAGQITYYSGTNTLSGTSTGTGVLTALGNNVTGSNGIVLATSPTITTPTTSGNVTATGTGALFLADFSNATVASRFSFQTSTTNGLTGIYALPNGSATGAAWQATNNSDPTNASKIMITTNAFTDVQLVSGINGTGTYLPLSIYTGGGVSAQFSATKGIFTLGVSGSTAGVLNIAGSTSGTVSIQGAAGAGTYNFNLPTSAGTSGQPLLSGGGGASSMTFGTLGVSGGGTGASSASITAFNNITGYTASGATGTTSTDLVFSTSPTLVTPNIGVATATSVNGLTITSSTGTLTITNGKTASFSNTLTLAGTDSTTMTFPSTSSTVLTTGNTATITKGYTVTPASISTGSFTVTPANGNYQYVTNNGAYTITAPASDCAVDILVTNGASAGATTFSGFTVGVNIGSALTTTNTNRFIISVRRINSISTYSIYALQ